MSNITIINTELGVGPTVQSVVPQSIGNNSTFILMSMLVFIFVFAAAALKCSVVGTAILENIGGGSFIYAPVIRPDNIEHHVSAADVSDDVDVDIPSPTSDALDDPIRSMARAALVSVQQLVLTYFQIFAETATMGVLQTVSEDTDVE